MILRNTEFCLTFIWQIVVPFFSIHIRIDPQRNTIDVLGERAISTGHDSPSWMALGNLWFPEQSAGSRLIQTDETHVGRKREREREKQADRDESMSSLAENNLKSLLTLSERMPPYSRHRKYSKKVECRHTGGKKKFPTFARIVNQNSRLLLELTR